MGETGDDEENFFVNILRRKRRSVHRERSFYSLWISDWRDSFSSSVTLDWPFWIFLLLFLLWDERSIILSELIGWGDEEGKSRFYFQFTPSVELTSVSLGGEVFFPVLSRPRHHQPNPEKRRKANSQSADVDWKERERESSLFPLHTPINGRFVWWKWKAE